MQIVEICRINPDPTDEIARTEATTPVPVEIETPDVRNEPAEISFRIVGYFAREVPTKSDAQSTVPKFSREIR